MRDDLINKVEQKYGKVYANSLRFTMSAEGLFANNPNDKGGMTYQGIARVYNGNWDGWKIIDKYLRDFPELVNPFTKPPISVSRLNKVLSEDLELGMLVFEYYYTNYFVKSGAESISKVCDKASVVLFDICVLQGVKRAAKTIQRLLNRYYGYTLVVDGILGNNTLNAFKDACLKDSKDSVINHLLLEYTDNLNEASKLDNNAKFLAGWLNRVLNLRNYLRLLK